MTHRYRRPTIAIKVFLVFGLLLVEAKPRKRRIIAQATVASNNRISSCTGAKRKIEMP